MTKQALIPSCTAATAPISGPSLHHGEQRSPPGGVSPPVPELPAAVSFPFAAEPKEAGALQPASTAAPARGKSPKPGAALLTPPGFHLQERLETIFCSLPLGSGWKASGSRRRGRGLCPATPPPPLGPKKGPKKSCPHCPHRPAAGPRLPLQPQHGGESQSAQIYLQKNPNYNIIQETFYTRNIRMVYYRKVKKNIFFLFVFIF